MSKFDCQLECLPPVVPARQFTLDEANRSLVLVRRIVADIVGGYQKLMELQETLEALPTSSREQCESTRRVLIQTIERLQGHLEELEEVGVELRDWALGVVDFPCTFNGRQIMLTWQHGEAGVGHWHDVADSYTNRHCTSTLVMEQMAGARR